MADDRKLWEIGFSSTWAVSAPAEWTKEQVFEDICNTIDSIGADFRNALRSEDTPEFELWESLAEA